MNNINDNNKKQDRDFRPSEGQKSNERWDDANLNSGPPQDANLNSGPPENENTSDKNEKQGLNALEMDEQRNTSGYGSSQRRATDIASGTVGPLDSDLSELPSQKRRNR